MRRTGVIIAFCLAAACDETGLGPRPELAIDASTTDMEQGGTALLRPIFDGEPVSPTRVTWTSRDRSTVLVAEDGVARGVAPGVTWVVGQYGDAKDSVRIRVRFAGVGTGTVAARIGDESRLRLGGRGYLIRHNPDVTESVALRAADVGDLDPGGPLFLADSLIDISFPGPLAVGTRDIPAPTVTIEANGFGTSGVGGHVLMRVRQADGTLHIYVPAGEGSHVELTAVTAPTGLGYADGRVTGAVTFEAAAFVLGGTDSQGNPLPPRQLSPRTIPVYAQFELTLESMPLPSGTFELAAGGATATSPLGGNAVVIDGGVRFDVSAVFPVADGHRFAVVQGWLPSPGVGTPALVRQEYPVSFGQSGGPDAWVIYQEGLSTSPGGSTWQPLETGTLTVTEYRAPTAERYGVLAGTLDATFAPPGGGEPRSVRATFTLNILPLGRLYR